MGVWVQLSPAGVTGKQPIICLLSSQLCLYVKNSRFGGQVGTLSVEGVTDLLANTWYHLALRYEAESTFFFTLYFIFYVFAYTKFIQFCEL